MKELEVKRIAVDCIVACNVPGVLDAARVEWQPIGVVNWREFPYCPRVWFRIAYTGSAILLHYKVTEESVAAVADRDNGNVWEDSCVEFFSMPVDDGIYYNIECNCVGTILIGAGRDRTCRELAPRRVLDGVRRWASLGRSPFPLCDEETEWEVALVIPFDAYFKHSVSSLDGKTMPANFFKCGDCLCRPHFLSWNPVAAPSPDFHRPECFGLLHFE